jgi:hypothetical protein
MCSVFQFLRNIDSVRHYRKTQKVVALYIREDFVGLFKHL